MRLIPPAAAALLAAVLLAGLAPAAGAADVRRSYQAPSAAKAAGLARRPQAVTASRLARNAPGHLHPTLRQSEAAQAAARRAEIEQRRAETRARVATRERQAKAANAAHGNLAARQIRGPAAKRPAAQVRRVTLPGPGGVGAVYEAENPRFGWMRR